MLEIKRKKAIQYIFK
uniref:Uncharacterized protein n=1 Tax=Anguilla anguilla TaxID=7936 RepID=A0A0E9UL14_ANGAN